MLINDGEQVKSRAMTGVLWKFMEKIGMQAMQFVIQIVLARILMPEDYGIVGLLTIFITISDVFILQGFTTALIQKKDADEVDFSSVFIANIVMAIIIYGILYMSAPFVAGFYNEDKLTLIMRVLSLNVIVGSFSAVHNSIMSRNLEFKKSFFRVMANVMTQGIVGISCACAGMGVWSLVFSKLAGTAVGSVVICATVKWRPKRLFSFKRLKSLFSYSSKILGTNLLNTFFNNIHSIVIGKFFIKSELGYYQRGQQIPQVLMTAVDGSLNEVLYPTLSKVQNDMEKVKSMLRRSMKTSMFIVLPLMFGLVATAESITLILLTEKWLPSVHFMQLSCVICSLWPLSARTHALNAIGKSDVTFKLSLISKGLTLLFIFICIPFGIYAIMYGTICTSSITIWITSYFVSKYIGYSIKEFLRDLVPTFAISGLMLVVVYAVGLINVNVYMKLLMQIVSGVLSYIGMAKILRLDSFYYVINLVNRLYKF